MAIFTLSNADDIDMTQFALDFIMQDPMTMERSSTRFAYLVDQSHGLPGPDLYILELLGSGFTYNAAGDPTGGAITTMRSISNNDELDFTITGLSLSAATLSAAINSSSTVDDRALFASMFSGNDQITMLGGNDILMGYAGNDLLIGGAGNDKLYGGLGADRMEGGVGNDVYYVDNALDTVIENVGEGTDAVSTSVSFNFGTRPLENLFLTGTAAVNGIGNALNNAITGNAAANILQGMDGDDKLNGGLGNDILKGAAGSDNFVFNTRPNTSSNRDTITDFANTSGNNDLFHLENAIFTKLAAGALSAANFRLGTAAADSNDYVIYNKTTGILSYDADGNGAGAAVQVAILSNKATLTVGDFFVI